MQLCPESCSNGQSYPKSCQIRAWYRSVQARPQMLQSLQQDLEASASRIMVTAWTHGAAFTTGRASLKASVGSMSLPSWYLLCKLRWALENGKRQHGTWHQLYLQFQPANHALLHPPDTLASSIRNKRGRFKGLYSIATCCGVIYGVCSGKPQSWRVT